MSSALKFILNAVSNTAPVKKPVVPLDTYPIFTKLEALQEHTGVIHGIGAQSGLLSDDQRGPGTLAYHLEAVDMYAAQIRELLYAAGYTYDG